MVGLGYSAQIQSYGRLLRDGYITFNNAAIIPDGYLNFGVETPSDIGAGGYGLRDNAGVVQYKNDGGAWQSFPTGGAAPDDATYILQTPNAALTSAQAMSALGSGLVFSTTATGVQSTVASVATGQVLVSNGTGVAPVYSAKPSLSSIVFAGGQVLDGTTANRTDLRNGASGQKLRVFGSYTDAANNSYAYLEDAGGTVARLNTAKAGSGTASDLYLGAGDFSRWIIAAASPHFVPNSNNTADLGSSGSQVRSGYFGTSVVIGGVTITNPTTTTAAFSGAIEAGTGSYVYAKSFVYFGAAGTTSRLASVADGSAQLRTNGGTDTAIFNTKTFRASAGAFSTVPSAPVEGMICAITDSSTATWGATITGGGANHVLGYYNGTNWTVVGI